MSENKHTPEPWFVGEINHKKQRVDIDTNSTDPRLLYKSWAGLARTYGCEDNPEVGSDVMEANARRIVACVNACAGISTENLEDNKPVIDLAKAYNVAIRQRDELLAALTKLSGMKLNMIADGIVDKAIASVKGA